MSEVVREMFATIAPRYDLANELLSLGTHRRWRRALVKRAQLPAGASILDCATGTGDLALEFARAVGPSGKVTGIDFCEPMLAGARDKARAAGVKIDFRQADAQKLPFDSGRFDLVSIAFGIRNVDDPGEVLARDGARGALRRARSGSSSSASRPDPSARSTASTTGPWCQTSGTWSLASARPTAICPPPRRPSPPGIAFSL